MHLLTYGVDSVLLMISPNPHFCYDVYNCQHVVNQPNMHIRLR